jgi:hypothetical protein
MSDKSIHEEQLTPEDRKSLDEFSEACRKQEERWRREIKEWANVAAGQVERPTRHERKLSELSSLSDLLESPVGELETKIRTLYEARDLEDGFVQNALAHSYALKSDKDTLAWAYCCLMEGYLWETKYKHEAEARKDE